MSLMGLDVEAVDYETEYLCPEECGCGSNSTLVMQVEYDCGG